MNSNTIQVNLLNSQVSGVKQKGKQQKVYETPAESTTVPNELTFKGVQPVIWSKLQLRKLFGVMQNPSEITSSIIQFIGTAGVAPFAIMCTHDKHAVTPEQKKEKREKNFFQALRQPISAFLAIACQWPTVKTMQWLLNKCNFDWKLFWTKDKAFAEFGEFIPNEKYLKGVAETIYKGKGSEKLRQEWQSEISLSEDLHTLKQGLKEKLMQDYTEVGKEISDSELEKLASNPKKLKEYTIEKMAKTKRENLIKAKIEELKNKGIKISDFDLVTSDYSENLVNEKFKTEIAKLKKEHKVTWWREFLGYAGLRTKSVKAYEKALEEFQKEKAIELIKKEMPNLTYLQKLEKYVRNQDAEIAKLLKSKHDITTLGVNVFVTAISCLILNRVHPIIAGLVDKLRAKRAEQKNPDEKKVEVKA